VSVAESSLNETGNQIISVFLIGFPNTEIK
jgi:hypothetical protein